MRITVYEVVHNLFSMTIKNFLKLKAANILGFTNINDNPYYNTYQVSGGFRFQDYNQTNVIEDGYAKNADLYSIVRKISTSASTIPLKLYDIKADGEKELITDGELYNLLQQPNRLQTFTEFLDESMIYLLLSGNNYINGYKSLGMGDVFRELNVLSSQFVTIETGGIERPIKAYSYQDTRNITFDADDVMMVKYPNPKGDGVDRLYGLSPLQAGNMALQSSNNIYDAKGNIITNQGASGILSDQSERSMRKEDAEHLQDAWDKKQKAKGGFGKTLVSSANLAYLQMGMSSSDLQLIENGVIDLRSLCNIYAVPSQLFNDVAGTTFNNMDAAKKSLYTEAVLPNLNLWLKSFNNWFINDWSKHDNKNYCLEADISSIEVLQSNQKEEADKDKVNMEGVNIVLNMPIGNEAKIQILKETYDVSQELANILLVESAVGVGGGESSNLESTPEAVDQNAIAQANLRGSVGGVQGILSIQQSVASGITSVNSAVTTMIEIYGFDNATARSILGV